MTPRVEAAVCRRGAAMAAALPRRRAAGNDLHTGSGAERGPGGTNPGAAHENGAEGRISAPPDLAGFVAARSVSEVALALGLSRKCVYRLRQGYWPADARRIERAWAEYQAPRALVISGWFLRRVNARGAIRHAGREYGATALLERAGHLVAVARTDGGLLAQTLELPAVRIVLAEVSAPQP